MPIFNRDTAPLSLTYAGQMYVKAAREVMSIDTNLLNEIEEIKKESTAACGWDSLYSAGCSYCRWSFPSLRKSIRMCA